PAASFTVTAYVPSLSVTVDPLPPPLNQRVQVVVHAVDSRTNSPVAGRVWIDGHDIEATDKPFQYTFRARRTGPVTEPIFVYPKGTVKAREYPDSQIHFGFD